MLGDLINSHRDGRIPEEDTLVSEALALAASLSLQSGAVVEQDSVEWFGCWMTGNDGDGEGVRLAVDSEGGVGVGVDGRGVISTTGGETVAIAEEIGSRSFFSLMLSTMRSRPIDVICFSFPRPRLAKESSRTTAGLISHLGRLIWCSILSACSDAADSTLAESSGMSADSWRSSGKTEASFDVAGSTQKVSRVHSLQLRFSRRRPSSM